MYTDVVQPFNYSTAQQIKQALTEVLPEIVTRKRASELTGGFISPKTMANLDSLNRGPAKKIMIGKQVGYMKNDFIDFFLRQIK